MKSTNSTPSEIEQFIGLHMYMTIIKLPKFYMCCASETRYPPVADVLSINQYQTLKENLQSDKSKCDESENKGNKLYKFQLVLDHVQENCIVLRPEIEHSIDEQIIPVKTFYSGIRQCNAKKPVTWGFIFFFVLEHPAS